MFKHFHTIILYACPCAYYGDPVKACTCSNPVIPRYQKRLSGPLLDRIEIHTTHLAEALQYHLRLSLK